MYHKTDITLINAHAKGNSRHDNSHLVIDKVGEDGVALLGAHAGVVVVSVEAFLIE